MPYTIREEKGHYCVYKVGDTAALQCYDNRQDALQYLAALESNVEDAKMKLSKRSGSAIKALSENRVGGYLVRFTSADDPDLYGEYFTKATDFWIERGYPVKGERALLEHGLEDFAKVMPIGLIDMVKEDDFGLYVEAKLNDRADYERMLKDMRSRKSNNLSDTEISQKAELATMAIRAIVATGKVGWSSGALPQGVVVNSETGHIESWPIIEGSLTFTPAESDGTEIAPIKTALEQLKDFLKSMPATTSKDAQHIENAADKEQSITFTNGTFVTPEGVTVVFNEVTNPTKSTKQGKNTMEILQKIVAMINEYLAAMGGSDEADDMAMATAVVDELKAETSEEEIAKAMDDEELVAKLAEKAFKLVDTRLEKKAKALKALEDAKEARLKKLENQQSANDPFPSGGKRNEFTGNRVSVGETLKYAHLSASDMALGIIMKLAPAKSQGIHVNMRDAFSENYLRTFANKSMKFSESEPYTKGKLAGKSFGHWQQAQSADSTLKSLIPFKANELNASDISGQGADWVSEWWSTDLWERERFERHYDALVQRGMMVQTIPQGADTAHFPTEGSDPVAYVAPQANSVGADGRPETTANFSPYATGVVDCTPLEIKIATSQTVILEEDSIINVVQNVNRQLNEAALETRDKLLVNGDDSLGTTNINYDGAQVPLGLQRPYYTAADGFRLHGLTNNAVDASNTLALETYRLTLAELDPELRQYYERMVFFIDPTTEMASLAIPEIATDDVRRSFATVTSGRILNVYGIDVRVNGFIPQTDTDGKVTASGNVANRGTILLVYAPYWGFAYKRNITLETARNIYSGTNDYVMSMRIGMVARGTNATALSYNVATAVS